MKLEYNLAKILKDNLIYIITLVVLISSFVAATFFFLGQMEEIGAKIATNQTEVNELTRKKELIQFKDSVIKDEINLDQINAAFTQLIPNQEDYFSIIATLENLSAQSNFIITAYTIDLGQSTSEQLAITIEGQGDPQTFLEFMRNYNFGGGRLITMDKINYSTKDLDGSKIDINVYRGKGQGAEAFTNLTPQDKELIQTVMEKVQVQLKSDDTEVADYPTKTNPF